MKNKKTFKVVMLPTEKASKGSIYLTSSKTLAICDNGTLSTASKTAQHLYIISDDEIKEGDWFIHDNKLFQCGFIAKYTEASGKTGKTICDDIEQKGFDEEACKKVIATTDPELCWEKGFEGILSSALLPKLPESFIQAYIKAYNEDKPITEVDLEMETSQTRLKQHNNRLGYVADCGVSLSKIIKTRPDNTVIVHQSKFYSKKEVEQKIRRAINDIFGKLVGLPQTSINKWIEENL